MRDKACKPIEPISDLTTNASSEIVTYQTVQILPTYTIIIPTNTMTTTNATIEGSSVPCTIDNIVAIPTTTEIYLQNVTTSHIQHQQMIEVDDHTLDDDHIKDIPNASQIVNVDNMITTNVENPNLTDTFGCNHCEFR